MGRPVRFPLRRLTERRGHAGAACASGGDLPRAGDHELADAEPGLRAGDRGSPVGGRRSGRARRGQRPPPQRLQLDDREACRLLHRVRDLFRDRLRDLELAVQRGVRGPEPARAVDRGLLARRHADQRPGPDRVPRRLPRPQQLPDLHLLPGGVRGDRQHPAPLRGLGADEGLGLLHHLLRGHDRLVPVELPDLGLGRAAHERGLPRLLRGRLRLPVPGRHGGRVHAHARAAPRHVRSSLKRVGVPHGQPLDAVRGRAADLCGPADGDPARACSSSSPRPWPSR